MKSKDDFSNIKVMIFDTFGTVVDWHTSVVKEGIALGEKYGFEIDWHAFANEWRDDGYIRAIFETAQGLRPWEKVDDIHLKKLTELIDKYSLNEKIPLKVIENFNLVWHRLRPWPDSVEGLMRFKKRYAIGPFSNGDFRLILDMAKNANLPWDFIATADLFKKFKPDPSIYRDCVKLLDLPADEVMMVAAHPFDLDGAVKAGCRTAFIPRPLEYGAHSNHEEPEPECEYDLEFKTFTELAEFLGV